MIAAGEMLRRLTMKAVAWVTASMLIASPVFAAGAGDAAEGERLYGASCTGCHDTGVHTRSDRTVHSLDELRGQLDACTHMAKKQFTPEQKQDLITYLNDRFYHFR
jgi:hypothetical protein